MKQQIRLTESDLIRIVVENVRNIVEEMDIDPKNKGKFTATQKRTGKSTEELCHSKNELTRKRANFAKMAKRHWKPLKENRDLNGIINESVKMALNELSPEIKARAMVKANHDLQRLNLSDKDVETNLSGEPVHKDTQKRRRDRQVMAFKKGLEGDLTRKFRRDVKFGIDSTKRDERDKKWNDDDDTYYDNLFSVDYDDDKFRHFTGTDSSYSGTRFSPKDNTNVDRRDMRATDYLTKMVDGMAGYDSELKGHYPYNSAIKHNNNRAKDVENIRKYRQDMQDYEERQRQHDWQMREYNSLPWYRKPFNKKPSDFRINKPQPPETKTGPYFMPDNPEVLHKDTEKLKASHKTQMDAYNNFLKKK